MDIALLKQTLTQLQYEIDLVDKDINDDSLTAVKVRLSNLSELINEDELEGSKWKVGDRIKITANSTGHGYEIGDKVTIVFFDGAVFECRINPEDSDEDTWFVHAEDGYKIND